MAADNRDRLKRIAAALAVVILGGALLLGLFSEARAVEVNFTSPSDGTSFRGSQVYTVEVEVPSGEILPIEAIDGVIERQTSSGTKAGADLVERVRCTEPLATLDCSSTELTTVAGTRTGISRIQLASITDASGNTLTAAQIQQSGSLDITTTGYGYSNTFGYGYATGGAGTNVNLGTGDGFGYGSGTLVLTFSITVNSCQLQVGTTHYLTTIVRTGSSTLSDVSSPFISFNPQRCGGGGGGGTGPVTGPGSGPISVSVGQSFNGQAGQTIQVTSGLPPGIQSLSLVLSQGCTGCSISVTVSTTPPAGSSSMAPGFTGISFLTIELRDSNGNVVNGGVSSGTLGFEVNDDDLPGNAEPRQVLLLRDNNGWQPLQTSHTSGPNADPHTFRATLPGFSVFAIAVDTAGPSISNTQPTGTIQQVAPSISASWTDNRGVDPSSLQLRIDGEAHDGTTGDLTTTSSGFTYIPDSRLDTSEHTVEATVSDLSGISTTESWSFTISTSPCPVPPRILSTQPTDGATGVAVDATIQVTIEAGSCDVDTARLTINGDPVPGFTVSIPAGETGTATSVLPTGIGPNETVNARAQIEDTGGNKAAKSWSFDTQQGSKTCPDGSVVAADEDCPDVPPGGIPGWVWFLIILVVLIAAGVGSWYWYDQQQNGGGRGGGGTGGGGP